jgi:predicted nucleic acid-binding protein
VDGLSEQLARHALIGLDTSVFIYHFEAHPLYSPLTLAVFTTIEQGQCAGVTSVLTLMEINVRPRQLGREDVARKYEALLVHFPNLRIVAIDREISRQAARLRATYHLRPADAIQVAACQVHGAGAIVTTARVLQKLKPVIDVLILDDFLATELRQK